MWFALCVKHMPGWHYLGNSKRTNATQCFYSLDISKQLALSLISTRLYSYRICFTDYRIQDVINTENCHRQAKPRNRNTHTPAVTLADRRYLATACTRDIFKDGVS